MLDFTTENNMDTENMLFSHKLNNLTPGVCTATLCVLAGSVFLKNPVYFFSHIFHVLSIFFHTSVIPLK